MAALADVTEIGLWSVGDGVPEPHASRATGDRPVGPDLLAEAAAVLPVVVGRGPLRCVDLHTALHEAACMQGMGRDRPHRLLLADEAFDHLAAYLVAAGVAEPGERSKDTVRAWLLHLDQVEVQLTLAAAAGYWRRELTAALTGC